jgi:RHS repeat-associated protein
MREKVRMFSKTVRQTMVSQCYLFWMNARLVLIAMLLGATAPIAYGQVTYVSGAPPVASGTVPLPVSMGFSVKASGPGYAVVSVKLLEGNTELDSKPYSPTLLADGETFANLQRNGTLSTTLLTTGTHVLRLRTTVISNSDISPLYLDSTNFPVIVTDVTRASQAITFDQPNPVTFGLGLIPLIATSTSTYTVSFTAGSLAVCEMSGAARVKLNGVGTCTITASQDGDARFFAAPNVQRNLAVNMADQSIIVTTIPDKAMGGGNFSIAGNATVASGLPIVFGNTSTSSICTVLGSTVTLKAQGLCMITADQAGNSNYNKASQVTLSFTVTPPAQLGQTIQFNQPNPVTFGSSPIPLVATSTSTLAVSFVVSPLAICEMSGPTSVKIKGAGTCIVTAKQAGNTSFLAALDVIRNLIINPANQSINVKAIPDKAVGGVAFDITLNAIATSGLSVAFVSNTSTICTVVGAMVTLKTAGTCTIMATQLGNVNYLAASQQTLTFNVAGSSVNFISANLASPATGIAPLAVTVTYNVKAAISNNAVLWVDLYDGAAKLNRNTCPVTFNVEDPVNSNCSTSITSSVSTVGVHDIYLLVTTIDRTGVSGTGYSTHFPVTVTAVTDQTITFAALPAKTLGDAAFSVFATSDSTLPITFTSITPSICTVTTNGLSVILKASGLCTIAADQAADATHNAAQQVARSFAVNAPTGQINQTITFTALPAKTLGDAAFSVFATSDSTLPITFTSITPSICTVTTNGLTVILKASGLCTIAADQVADATHNAAQQVARSFAVNTGGTAPILNVFARTPSPMIAGQNQSVNWTSSNATSISYKCTAEGTGFKGEGALPLNGPTLPDLALTGWVGFPSDCTWTATGPGGVLKVKETLFTVTNNGLPIALLNTSAKNVQVATGASGTVALTGLATNGAGQVSKIELFQDSGAGYGATPVQTVTGPAVQLNINYSFTAAAGTYRFKLKSTGSNAVVTESSYLLVNIIDSTLKGVQTGVRSNASSTPILYGWVCQDASVTAVNYQVSVNAPISLGGTSIATGTANLTTEVDNADVLAQCHIASGGRSFNVDLSSFTSLYAGARIYVQASVDSGAHNYILPCNDSCTMPGSLRIGLATPNDGDRYLAPGNVFMQAKLANGTGPYDEIAFSVDGVWTVGAPDGAVANTYYANQAGLAARTAPYIVMARVRQGGNTLYTVANRIYVDPTSLVTINLGSPSNGATATAGSPVSLSATTGGVGTVSSVKFYANGNLIATGVASGSTWTAQWSSSTVGTYIITARAFSGTGPLLAISAAATITVNTVQVATPSTPIAIDITPPHLGNTDAGSLPGSLGVGGSGAATYSVALVVPPGTAGLQPNLSLDYSSQGANGMLGLGWSLGGLSSIHRCGKTIAQDGVNDRISFSNSDRLCLNGQRLVLVNLTLSDVNYWVSTAEYRTEIDSFTRIKRFGTGFKVETKDGRVSIYGTTTDSYVKAILGTPKSGTTAPQPQPKSGAQSWAIDSITDRKNNFIRFTYEQDGVTGEHRPVYIFYGGAGLSAHAAVQLTYEARNDAWTRYIDETRNDLRTRISHIKTYVGSNLNAAGSGTIVRDYNLQYDYSPTSGRSLLNSMQVSARNSVTNTMETLPATSFAWGKPVPGKQPGFESKGMWTGAPILTTWKNLVPGGITAMHHADYFAFSDFENNGRTDVMEKRVAPVSGLKPDYSNVNPAGMMQSQYRYFHNNGDGFTLYSYKLSTGEQFVVLDIGDFNGDGAPDLLTSTAAGAKICLSPLNKPSALGSPGSTITFTCDWLGNATGANSAGEMPYVVDVNGDGRAAHYSRIGTDGAATLYIQGDTINDTNPPSALAKTYGDDGTPEFSQHEFTSLNQQVDFTGIGKPYDVRWSRARFAEYIYDTDGTRIYNNKWTNLKPTVVFDNFNMPDSVANIGSMANYSYPSYATPPNRFFSPYTFDKPHQGAGLSGDFSGSGYNSLLFGFIELEWLNNEPTYKRAETTFCQSTGRALDCSVLKEYSGAQFLSMRAVGNFVGDGQPSVLSETMAYQAGLGPTPTGNLQMCRIKGEDTTGGTGTNDTNMVCTPWSGLTMPGRTTPTAAKDQAYFMDLFGTGRSQLVVYHSGYVNTSNTWVEDGRWEVFAPIDLAGPNQALDRIYQVSNGVGATSIVEYADGLPSGIVSKSGNSDLSYPQHTAMSPGKLVKRLRIGNGTSPDRTVSYQYQDAALDLAGRGALGFAKVTSTDEQTGIVNSTVYSQEWPFTGMVKSASSTLRGCTFVDTQNVFAQESIPQVNGSNTLFPYVESSVAQSRDIDQNCSELSMTSAQNIYGDHWGNLIQQDTATTGFDQASAFSSQTINTYSNTSSTWLIGLLKSSMVSKSDPITGTLTRNVAFKYDATGLLSKETIEPNIAQYKLATTYVRSNPFGLVNQKNQAWFDPATSTNKTRTLSDTTYDANGRYPNTVKNALGQQETHAYDPATGARQSLTGPNLLTTTWDVNGFGRVTKEKRADGNETRSYVKACNNDCPFGASVIQITDSFHGADRISVPQMVYSDNVGHVLRSQSWGFDKTAIVTDQRYDALGRLYETDLPRYSNGTAYLSSRQYYDELNRVVKVITKDDANADAVTTTQYQGLVTILTNPMLQQRIDTRNVAKQLVQARDAKLGLTQFEYEPFGNLSQTIDPNGNVITVTYDNYGHKTELNDPDLGIISYSVDPIGQTWKQVSPKQLLTGKSTTFTYDLLGRMTARLETDLKSYWVFDNAPGKGIGQLAEAYTQAGSTKDYDRLHTYDTLGRPLLTTQVLANNGSYASLAEYDAWGRAVTQTYQRNTDAAKVFGSRYNNAGYLYRIERGSLPLWQVNIQDAANRPIAIVLGNGLTQTRHYKDYTGRMDDAQLKTGTNALRLQETYLYDKLGSVTTRSQYWDTTGFQENFTYDDLNRLATSQIVLPVIQAAQSFTYFADGSLKTKTNVGNNGLYSYPWQGQGSIQPHAVQSIAGVAGSFTYDENGNQIGGAGRTTTWTSFDMPLKITMGGINSNFVYGPEHQRTKQVRSDGTTILYAGAQEIETKGTVTTVKTYWPGGIGVEIERGAAATELNWTHLDRLGSVVAISAQDGTLREKLAYDAWGKRRNLSDSSTPNTIDGVTDNKGYTGHEMLDLLDLVHMNGRVYDPLVAKFLSGDPLIQDPTNGQNYNRYSYVMNNPTNLTDPTGFANNCVASGSDTKACDTTAKDITPEGSITQTIELTAVKSNSSSPTAKSTNVIINNTGSGENRVNPKNNNATNSGTWRKPGPNEIPGQGADGAIWEPTRGPHVEQSSLEKAWEKTKDVGAEVLYRAQGIPGEGMIVGGLAGSLSKTSVVAIEGPVIIGETMARVEAAAAKIPGSKILNDMPDFKAMGMSASQVTSAMMQYNRKWILDQIRSGRQIIDIGLDPNRGIPSIFYQMEQNMMKNYLKLQQQFK